MWQFRQRGFQKPAVGKYQGAKKRKRTKVAPSRLASDELTRPGDHLRIRRRAAMGGEQKHG